MNSDPCDERFENSCYVIVSAPMHYAAAISNCQAMGGHLVTIDSEEENSLIQRIGSSKMKVE